MVFRVFVCFRAARFVPFVRCVVSLSSGVLLDCDRSEQLLFLLLLLVLLLLLLLLLQARFLVAG